MPIYLCAQGWNPILLVAFQNGSFLAIAREFRLAPDIHRALLSFGEGEMTVDFW